MEHCQDQEGDTTKFPRPLRSDDEFYRAIHPDFLKENGKISPGAFSKATKNNKVSVDWAERCTAVQTYDRWERWGEGRGVASIIAQQCWDNDQTILFAPTTDNPAHSEVASEDWNKVSEDRIRKNLARAAKLVISAEGPEGA